MTTEQYMRIREADLTDVAAIAKVHVASWRTTYRGIVPDEHLDRLSHEWSERALRNLLSAGCTRFVYIAEDAGGKVVGFACGGPERGGDAVYKGELYGIYLLEEYQRKGIGRRLTATVAGRLLEEGFESMLVWVLADNPSRPFYEALGGEQLYEEQTIIEGVTLVKVAYGWQDIQPLADAQQ
jgi:GNAT superfamily N-acetyltransferase